MLFFISTSVNYVHVCAKKWYICMYILNTYCICVCTWIWGFFKINFIDIYVYLLVSFLLCKLDKIGQYHMFNVYLSHVLHFILNTCIIIHVSMCMIYRINYFKKKIVGFLNTCIKKRSCYECWYNSWLMKVHSVKTAEH